jgi:epoxyqueuosine reductase
MHNDERVRTVAKELGFEAVAVARADVPLGVEFERYRAFLAEGMHGEMGWLAENAEVRRRLDTRFVLQGAKSVVCVARRYQRPLADEARDPATARAIARYARGRDYHSVVRKKVRRLAAFLRSLGTPSSPVAARPLIDDAPVLERVWAARAGLGFIGKNGLLIVPGEGSFVLLGEVATTLELTPDSSISERCGACTRCLDACPTGAFVRPFVLDPRRCVAYLTIEHRSAITAELREGVGEHLFGCDDCQSVCPFNAGLGRGRQKDLGPGVTGLGRGRQKDLGPAMTEARREARTRAFAPLEHWGERDIASLLFATDADVAESPLRRATPAGIARNAALVLGNQRDARALPSLERALAEHPSEVVREASAWAVARIRAKRSGDRPACGTANAGPDTPGK